MGGRVLKGGMLTTVQDLGRTGYQSQGFGVSGVMDVRSFKIANLLLDNPENEAVLEFTLMGPTLEFTSETIIAITGGDFQPQVNGKPIKNYTAVYIHRGDILSFRGARTGSRGYIAFSSYLDIPVVMGNDVGCPWITQYDFWRELYYFHKYVGVSNAFALYTATGRRAQMAGIGQETGTLEPGKAADLIVTAADPLADLRALRHVELVMSHGQLHRAPQVKHRKNVEAELDRFL